jgi:hypothetical protein
MKASTKAIRFLETLAIPEGPKAGQLIRLAMTQGKPSAALTARLGTKGQLTRTDALMAIYGALRQLEKQSRGRKNAAHT